MVLFSSIKEKRTTFTLIVRVFERIAIMIYEKWGNMKFKYRNREFWCRGYYVDTVGKNTKAIDEYISNQLREDELSNQMTLEEPDPFTGNK